MSHSNDNVESRERAVCRQDDASGEAAESPQVRDLEDRPGFSEAPPSYYPYAAREFVASGTLYEGGVSAQPPASDERAASR